MSQLELDPQFTQGLRLLHSTNKDSAEQLRVLLDEIIKQKYGPSKMLSNVLHKKVYIYLYACTIYQLVKVLWRNNNFYLLFSI